MQALDDLGCIKYDFRDILSSSGIESSDDDGRTRSRSNTAVVAENAYYGLTITFRDPDSGCGILTR